MLNFENTRRYQSNPHCLGGSSTARTCETTTKELHLIAGAVLPLWQRLKTTQDAQLKVVRVVTEDDQRIVGVKIPANRVQQVLRALGIACAISDPADIIHEVLKNDDQIALVQGLSLSRSRIYGESYVEIRGATHHKFGELRDMGLLNMRIDYRERFLLPTDTDEAIELLQTLLKRYPIVTPVNEAPQEIALPTTELRALAQTETVDIFDLLDAPRPAILPTIPPAASKPVEHAYIPPIYNSGFTPAQLSFWGAIDQAA